MLYITNSFSLSMLDDWRLVDSSTETCINIQPVDNPVAWLANAEVRHGNAVSVVGHADTAILYSKMLDRHVECNRQSIVIDESTELLIGQYKGARLPEGCTELPEGSAIHWIAVTIN